MNVVFLLGVLGFLGGVAYFLWNFFSLNCTCETDKKTGKKNCDACKPKPGLPPDTDCTWSIIACDAEDTLTDIADGGRKAADVISSNWFLIGGGIGALLLLIAYLVKKFRARKDGKKSATTEEEIDAFKGAFNERKLLQKKLANVDADFKETEDYIKEQLSEAKAAKDSAKTKQFSEAQKKLSDSKSSIKRIKKQVSAVESADNAKKFDKKNQSIRDDIAKIELSVTKVQTSVGYISQSTDPVAEAEKAQQQTELTEDEARRLVSKFVEE
jgi:hypothetical protein